MFGPPALDASDLAYLIAIAGGAQVLRRMLRYLPATVLTSGTPETLALLWYAGPHGRAAAAADLTTELRCLAAWNDALRRQLEEEKAELRKALAQVHRETANEPRFSDWSLPRKGGSLGREHQPAAVQLNPCAKESHRSATA